MAPRHERSHAAIQLGRRLASRRALLGWSRERLAEEAGTHPNYVGSLERGDQDAGLVTILRLARALGISPGELLDGIEPDEPPRTPARGS